MEHQLIETSAWEIRVMAKNAKAIAVRKANKCSSFNYLLTI